MSNREELRKKLKDSIKNKRIMRSTKDEKEKFVDNNLKNLGISDIEKFKEQIKKLNPEKLKQELNKYVVKREIYKFNDLNYIKSIIFNIQKQFESSEIINFPDIKRK
jgi:hypothetical protein